MSYNFNFKITSTVTAPNQAQLHYVQIYSRYWSNIIFKESDWKIYYSKFCASRPKLPLSKTGFIYNYNVFLLYYGNFDLVFLNNTLLFIHGTNVPVRFNKLKVFIYTNTISHYVISVWLCQDCRVLYFNHH